MSFIPKNDQKRIDDTLAKIKPAGVGELEYQLARVVLNFLTHDPATPANRQTITLAIGSLHFVAAMIQEKLAVPLNRGDQLAYGDAFQEIIRTANFRTL